MKTVALQSELVYGPLESRRFGNSLGINLLPANGRLCSFSCVYCQYKDEEGKLGQFPSFAEVYTQLLSDLERVRNDQTKVDWIMLSGNGEPTLHPKFPDIVDCLLTLRRHFLPQTPIGILSNSSTCHKKEIRDALSKLDGRFMKLDAGSLYIYHDINRPNSIFSWGDVIEGLCSLPGLTLQSMFVTGKADNTNDKAVHDWIEAVECIGPQAVQIYTIDRTPQEEGILPVEEERLQTISKRLMMKTGILSEVFC